MSDRSRQTEPERPALATDGEPAERSPSAASPTEQVDIRSIPTTQVRVAEPPLLAVLTVVAGPTDLAQDRFELRGRRTTIGRSPECAVNLLDPGVSRLHAILHYDGRVFSLEHKSGTNSTYVNGVPVEGVETLRVGDEIQLADRIRLRLDPRPEEAPRERRAAPARPETTGADSLASVMQARLDLEDRIERQFVRIGTFLDVDVVDSYGMKSTEASAERVIVSFERFRAFIGREVVGNEGQVLNSNGDEVMAFFASADAAVSAARSIMGRLGPFNRSENLLLRPFRVRQGAHQGRSAVDLRAGIAYSPVLDIAGHLQKAAPVGALLVSVEVYDALTNRDGFAKAGVVSKTEVDAYVLHPAES